MAAIEITGHKPRVTFNLEEGNFTRNDDFLSDQGPTKGGSFASQLKVGDEVQIYTGADMTVQALTNGIAIGRIANRPEYTVLPKVTTNSGGYVRRIATVELDGTIDRVKLADNNQLITPGTYLAVAAGKTSLYDKDEDSQTTNLIALQSAGASSGKYIRVLRLGQSAVAAD